MLLNDQFLTSELCRYEFQEIRFDALSNKMKASFWFRSMLTQMLWIVSFTFIQLPDLRFKDFVTKFKWRALNKAVSQYDVFFPYFVPTLNP